MQTIRQKLSSPSTSGWALLLALTTAVLLRFFQLGNWPPGLYRDEAFNGLDALTVLNGQHAIFFTANNGREPGYIYLTAVAIALFGRTALAVRLAAAVVGSLTTLLTYLLGKEWFGQRTGLFAAFLWAITLWPVHLSRIGLRPILLPLMLALTFWLATKAAKQQSHKLWLLAGISYGVSYYTYLAIRFTPLLIVLILLYLWWQKRPLPYRHLLWFVSGTLLALLPLLGWTMTNPEQFIGRTNQVSILNPIINGGDLWGTVWRHGWQGVGLFFWQGDTILRHNPAGRPLFDWLTAIPFIIGVLYCLWQWQRPFPAILLLWTAVMLGPTILAEDTPHFLRAVGILPAALLFPAIGLNQLWQWPAAPKLARQFGVSFLLVGSLIFTMRDYWQYSHDPEVALLFESAALELAQELKQEPEDTAVYLDQWFWDSEQGGWPSIPFITDLDNVTFYRPEFGVPPAEAGQNVAIYAWQFGALDFVPTLITSPAKVSIHTGPLARGDLEENAYPLYVRYRSAPLPIQEPIATFGEQFWLNDTDIAISETQLEVTLWWEVQTAVSQPWVAFVHLVGPDGLIAQDDAPPANNLWQLAWWQPNLWIEDNHTIALPHEFDPTQHVLYVGIYDPATAVRLPVLNASQEPVGDSWVIPLK